MINFFPVLSYYMLHITCFYPSALSCFLRSQSGFGKIICVMKDTSAFEASHIIGLNSLVRVDAIVVIIWNHDLCESRFCCFSVTMCCMSKKHDPLCLASSPCKIDMIIGHVVVEELAIYHCAYSDVLTFYTDLNRCPSHPAGTKWDWVTAWWDS